MSKSTRKIGLILSVMMVAGVLSQVPVHEASAQSEYTITPQTYCLGGPNSTLRNKINWTGYSAYLAANEVDPAEWWDVAKQANGETYNTGEIYFIDASEIEYIDSGQDYEVFENTYYSYNVLPDTRGEFFPATTGSFLSASCGATLTVQVSGDVPPSPAWTITPGVYTGSGNQAVGTKPTSALYGGTLYTITPTAVSGYTYEVYNSVTGSGASTNTTSSLTLFPEQSRVFYIHYTPVPPPPSGAILNVNSTGASSVTITSSQSGFGDTTNYMKTSNSDISTTLTAPSVSGYTFTGWTGGCTTSSTQCSIVVDADTSEEKTVTANYISDETPPPPPGTYNLTVNSSGASSVSITASPSTYSGVTNPTSYSKLAIAENTVIALTAPSTAGASNFTSWSGCGSTSGSGGVICNVTMSSDKTVTATYEVGQSSGGPDLIAAAPPQASAVSGTALNFTSIITNNGDEHTLTGFYNFFQVASAASGGGTRTDLTPAFMSAKAAGGYGTATSPSHTFSTAGTYSVRACADQSSSSNSGNIVESNENNNCSGWTNIAVTVSPPAGQPDLTAGVPPQTGATVDEALTFTSLISNIGSDTTGAGFSNIFQIATASGGGGTVSTLSPVTAGTLGVGSTQTITSPSYTFTSTGTKSVRACADKSSATNNGSITESNENNNCSGWTTVTVVESGADLPPVVTFTRPSSGATLSGVVASGDVNVIAYDPDVGTSDGQGIYKVVFQLRQGGTTVVNTYTDKSKSYDYGFDSVAYDNGSYTIRATATSNTQGGGGTAYTDLPITIYNGINDPDCETNCGGGGGGEEGGGGGGGGGAGSISVTCNVSASSAVLGETVTWTAGASGGTEPYVYTWSGPGIITNPAPTGNPLVITYSTIGEKIAVASVTDAGTGTGVCTSESPEATTININFHPFFEEF